VNRTTWLVAVALAAIAAASIAGPVAAASGKTGFGFRAADIGGFRTGVASLSGGGVFDPTTGVGHGSGGFSCLEDVAQGPLTGCLAGQGVRWDTDSLARSTTFKCTGAPTEALKTATTNPSTVVIHADFYRAGDANDESFRALIIVSQTDIAPDIDGVQNVWIQGVGCGTAVGSVSSGGPAA